jgi:2-C-methyl-D-erythritol 4-phosphate cytidylyltransferase
VIAAAGSGQRLGVGGPKAFVELRGRSLLARALDVVAASEAIETVVIAAPAGHEGVAAAQLAACAGIDGEVLAGGASRAESVRIALERVATELVLIHDAARPLAPVELFDAIVARLSAEAGAEAVIAASPIVDTIKRSHRPHHEQDPGVVAATVPRDDLWAAQTPQGFRTGALRAAQRAGAEQGGLAAATDEAGLIEAVGGTVLLERAPASNLKVTDGADLRQAGALLAEAAGANQPGGG